LAQTVPTQPFTALERPRPREIQSRKAKELEAKKRGVPIPRNPATKSLEWLSASLDTAESHLTTPLVNSSLIRSYWRAVDTPPHRPDRAVDSSTILWKRGGWRFGIAR